MKLLKNKIKNDEKGITIIALIVFVIILLVLAGSVLTIVFKNNGIFNFVNDTKDSLNVSEEKDKLNVAIKNAKTDYYMEYEEKLVTEDFLQKSLDEGVRKR